MRWPPKMRLRALGVIALISSLCISGADATTITEQIYDDLKSAQVVADVSGGEPLRLAPILSGFYAARGDTPGWVDDRGPLPLAQQMIETIQASKDDGLNPGAYHLAALERLITSMRFSLLPTASRHRRLAALDLLLSDAFLMLAEDELNGRANPQGLDLYAGARYRRDLTQDLQLVMRGTPPSTVIRSLAPQSKEYAALRAALARYRTLDAENAFTQIPPGPPLRIGDGGSRVVALVKRLEAEGDLPLGTASSTTFGPELSAAISRFQARHGLAVSGIADAMTFQVLNEPAQEWIDRLRVNMERWRWLPQNPESTRLVVNIADFSTTLYEQSAPVLSEPVVVGETYSQTPEFSNRIQYLVINPTWDVPPMIGGKEILPEVQHDPHYLERRGYVVLQGWGTSEHVVDPRSIDWNQWTAQTLPYRFRQLPGPENALGKIKFMFPNGYGVYLHDTPAQSLFSEPCRAFSHGCIRVAHAMQLAAALLRLDGRQDARKLLKEALASGATRQLDLTHPVPIYIVYMTAWVNHQGVVEFRSDVYGRDPELLRALDSPLPEYPHATTTHPAPQPAAACGPSRIPDKP